MEELKEAVENSKASENIETEGHPPAIQLEEASSKLSQLLLHQTELTSKLKALEEVEEVKGSEQNEIEEESELSREESIKTIGGDIPRTLSKEHVFKSEVFAGTLQRVLTAYAMYRADIGYVQGMSYI